MKKILLLLLVLISISSYSQKRVLVADETYFVESISGSVKIITSNENITGLILDELKGKINSLSQKIRKDRKGSYLENTFTFSKDYKNDVVKFLNSLPKNKSDGR